MAAKRQIKGKEFIDDLRSGMSPAALMRKYALSQEGLRKIFRIILNASAMEKEEIENLANLYQLDGAPGRMRRQPRKRIDFPLRVYDGIDQLEAGQVVDISSTGVKIKGINAKLGEGRTFIARFGTGRQGRPFVFEGVCRWIGSENDGSTDQLAGFEIRSISNLDAKELENLLLE